jgi:hypothetical protein
LRKLRITRFRISALLAGIGDRLLPLLPRLDKRAFSFLLRLGALAGLAGLLIFIALSAELKSLDKSIRDIEGQATRGAPVELDRVGEALRAIDPIWDVLYPEEQRRIAQLLVEEITVSTSGIDIRFRTNGIEQIVDELQPAPGIKERAHA